MIRNRKFLKLLYTKLLGLVNMILNRMFERLLHTDCKSCFIRIAKVVSFGFPMQEALNHRTVSEGVGLIPALNRCQLTPFFAVENFNAMIDAFDRWSTTRDDVNETRK